MQETLETRVQFLGPEDPLEEDMATRSSIPAWTFPGCCLIESLTNPCQDGIIIISLIKMRKQKLTEAELLGHSHRDGKWQFLNLYQDSNITKGWFGRVSAQPQ